MPQMMPLNWMMLYLIFSLFFITMLMNLHYMKLKYKAMKFYYNNYLNKYKFKF